MVNVFGGGVGFELLPAEVVDLLFVEVGVVDLAPPLSEALPLTNEVDIGTKMNEFNKLIK